MLDLDTQTQLRPHLLSGERLLWTGRPRQGIMLHAQDIYMIPFSLLWFGFVIVWEAIAITAGAPVFFMLWGVPFVLVGLYLVVGRLLHDAAVRRRLFYAVSDRRLLVLRTGLFGGVRSLDIARLPQLQLDEGRGGRGTLRFESSDEGFSLFRPRGSGWGTWVPSLTRGLRFEAIEQPRTVYELISRTASAA